MRNDAPKKTLETWHPGEKAIQATIEVVDRMVVVGQRVVRDHMPDQHREFYAQLPFIMVGSLDRQGDAWASFVAGQPGFMSSPTPTILDIDARPDPATPSVKAWPTAIRSDCSGSSFTPAVGTG